MRRRAKRYSPRQPAATDATADAQTKQVTFNAGGAGPRAWLARNPRRDSIITTIPDRFQAPR